MMRQFVVKRSPQKGLRSIECFEEGEHLEAAVAAELAQLEGLEARVFLGSDLIDVAQASPIWFGVPAQEQRAAA